MGSSLFGVTGESTYFGPLAITIRLRRARLKSPFDQAFKRGLGQRGELVISAIPLDFLVEFIAIGRGADSKVLDRGDIGEVI
ncbi:unannotated protein [freshwater metagenome]|uniref:Unannotated protein n=1 Tax=freshwater metagenome TaxID=449393 RepID=A0A6J6YI36_9ZZZZ